MERSATPPLAFRRSLIKVLLITVKLLDPLGVPEEAQYCYHSASCSPLSLNATQDAAERKI